MPSVINEYQQFEDEDTGELIVNGYIYIGTQNLDAKLNLITIYPDRALSGTPLANPQRTGSDGRALNKIWIPGKYSMKVEDSNNVQKLNVLDNGEDPQTGNTKLINILGVNDLVADASPTITTLIDSQAYIFSAPAAPTGAMTLKIDSTAIKDIKKGDGLAIESNDFAESQKIVVVYNESDDWFEVTSGALSSVFGGNVTIAGTLTVDEVSGNAVLDEDDLVSDSATKLATQQSIKAYVDGNAEVTDHVKAGNTQILSGDDSVSATYPFFDIDSNLTELAWESVGGTSSGADNIWTALDNMPSSARILIVDLQMIINSTALQQSSASVYACSNAIAGPSLDIETNMIGSYALNRNNTDNEGILIRTFIPVDSSQLFKLLYTDTLNDLGSYTLYYRGFITD